MLAECGGGAIIAEMGHRRLPGTSCLVCFTKFRPRRTWQRFCSPACRGDNRNTERSAEYTCVYCGLIANTVDHIPPISVRPTLVDLGLAGRYQFLEVRACQQCNSALGARSLWTVKQRKAWIKV